MKNIDIKSVIIGVLGTVLVFISMGAKMQDENLGDITVNSITVLNDGTGGVIRTYNSDGVLTAYLGNSTKGNGFIATHNTDGVQTSYLGAGKGGNGFIKTSNADGVKTSYLGTGEDGFGFIETYNADGVKTSYLGTGKDNDGIALLFDRYGDVGWGESGKN